jgi:hypothetical protein
VEEDKNELERGRYRHTEKSDALPFANRGGPVLSDAVSASSSDSPRRRYG